MLRINVKQLFIVLFLGLMTSSCDEASSALAPDEHTDADGLILELNGQEVYREFEGEIVTNTLTLTVGDTLELSVHFLDHDGNEIEHEEEEEEHDDHDHDDDHDSVDGLLVTENNTSIVVIEVEEHEEEEEEHDDHEEDHGSGIHMIAVAAGSTTFKIQLMHEGHSDYTSMSIAVTVGASTSRDLSSLNKYFN
jgi:hypothetical protein